MNKEYKCYELLKHLIKTNTTFRTTYIENIKTRKIRLFNEEEWTKINNQNFTSLVPGLNEFSDMFKLGYNIGNCVGTARQLSYSYDNVDIVSGTVPILKGTLNAEKEGGHCWLETTDYIIDTSLMLVIDKFNNYIYQNMIILGLLCLFVEPKTLNHLEIKTGVVDEDRMTIACIEQFNFGVDFNRENLNGFRLKFDRLGFLDGGEEAYLKLVDALNKDDGLFIIGYDDYVYEYWKRMGIEDYIFNEQYYKLDKESGDLKVSWDAYSFVHYVILYYMLGV